MLGCAQLVWWLAMAVVATIDTGAQSNIHRWKDVFSNGGLCVMVIVANLVGYPFTHQFAREKHPEHMWHLPAVVKISTLVSWFWLCLFLIQLGGAFIQAYFKINSGAENWILNILPVATVVIGLSSMPFLIKYLKERVLKQEGGDASLIQSGSEEP